MFVFLGAGTKASQVFLSSGDALPKTKHYKQLHWSGHSDTTRHVCTLRYTHATRNICRHAWRSRTKTQHRVVDSDAWPLFHARSLSWWHPEGGVVEALREIVEDTLLPAHFEAMVDEVGVEISRMVRKPQRIACLAPVHLRSVDRGHVPRDLWLYLSNSAALNGAPLLSLRVVVCCLKHAAASVFSGAGGAALYFGQPALASFGVPSLRRAVRRRSPHHPRPFQVLFMATYEIRLPSMRYHVSAVSDMCRV